MFAPRLCLPLCLCRSIGYGSSRLLTFDYRCSPSPFFFFHFFHFFISGTQRRKRAQRGTLLFWAILSSRCAGPVSFPRQLSHDLQLSSLLRSRRAGASILAERERDFFCSSFHACKICSPFCSPPNSRSHTSWALLIRNRVAGICTGSACRSVVCFLRSCFSRAETAGKSQAGRPHKCQRPEGQDFIQKTKTPTCSRHSSLSLFFLREHGGSHLPPQSPRAAWAEGNI